MPFLCGFFYLSPNVLSFFRSSGEHALNDNEQAKQRRAEDLGPPGVQVLIGDNGLYHTLNHYAHRGADDCAHTAGQQGSADNRGGNRIHFHPDILQRIPRQRIKAEHHARQRRAKAADGIDRHLGSSHRKPHQRGGLLVSPDRINGSAEAGEFQCEHCRNQHGSGNENVKIDLRAQKAELGQRHFLVKIVGDRNGLGADDGAQTAHKELSRQRYNKRLKPVSIDHESHQRAEQKADQQHQRDHHAGRHARPEQKRRKHAGERDGGRNRDIDAARQKDKRNADGSDDQVGAVVQQIAERGQRQEFRVSGRSD